MPFVYLALEEGFQHDQVFIEWNGKTQEYQDITTNYSAGVAKVIKLETTKANELIVISIPDKAYSSDIPLQLDSDMTVSVKLTDDGMEITTSTGIKSFF